MDIGAAKGILGIGDRAHRAGQYQFNASEGYIGGYGGVMGKCAVRQVYGTLAKCGAEFAAADFAAFFYMVFFTKCSFTGYEAILQIVLAYSVPIKTVCMRGGRFCAVKNRGEEPVQHYIKANEYQRQWQQHIAAYPGRQRLTQGRTQIEEADCSYADAGYGAVFDSPGNAKAEQHRRPYHIPEGEGQLGGSAYKESNAKHYQQYAKANAAMVDGTVFIIFGICTGSGFLYAQQLICGYIKYGGNEGDGTYIRAGYVIFPFAYSLW